MPSAKKLAESEGVEIKQYKPILKVKHQSKAISFNTKVPQAKLKNTENQERTYFGQILSFPGCLLMLFKTKALRR
jgi:hypothetical protein